MRVIKVIAAVLIPPVGAYLEVGLTRHFVINLVLTLLLYFPGIAHALWLVLRK